MRPHKQGSLHSHWHPKRAHLLHFQQDPPLRLYQLFMGGSGLERSLCPFPPGCHLSLVVSVVLNGCSNLPFPRALRLLPCLVIPNLLLHRDLSALEQNTMGKHCRSLILPRAPGTSSSSTAGKTFWRWKAAAAALCLTVHAAHSRERWPLTAIALVNRSMTL